MATRAGLGTIPRSSGIVRFVQGGVVKTFRCRTQAIEDSQGNPDANAVWARLPATLAEGDTVTGTVLHVAPYGAYLDIGFGVDAAAILKITDFANTSSPVVADDYPKIGDKMTALVRLILWDEHRITLTQVQVRDPNTGHWAYP